MTDTRSFEKIELKDMKKVKLMNRIDKKFWFNTNNLNELLQKISNNYFVMDIDGETELPYSTTYFDTDDNQLYLAHHNGRLNRFKVRKRLYKISGLGFLEVKFKNNKGRTLKTRIESAYTKSLSLEEQEFLREIVPFDINLLQPGLSNKFDRITLVNKNFSERCTLDTGLSFISNGIETQFESLAILEIKYSANSGYSPIMKVLREMHINPKGFSKYAIGKSLTDKHIKQNRFKQKLRMIEKITSNNN